MPFIEFDRTVTATSTGYTARLLGGVGVREWTVYADCPSGSSASFQFQTARDENSTTPPVPFGSTQNLSASSGAVLQFSGPLPVIFARVSDISGTINFRFVGN